MALERAVVKCGLPTPSSHLVAPQATNRYPRGNCPFKLYAFSPVAGVRWQLHSLHCAPSERRCVIANWTGVVSPVWSERRDRLSISPAKDGVRVCAVPGRTAYTHVAAVA
ncbi:hypothetical protein MRX96_047771 [Rhipicephalus microplus]